jgi:ribonuclease HI
MKNHEQARVVPLRECTAACLRRHQRALEPARNGSPSLFEPPPSPQASTGQAVGRGPAAADTRARAAGRDAARSLWHDVQVELLNSVAQGRTVVFCDGAAKGNPGPGGWGVVIATADGDVTELGGRAPHTTNNRMELTAAIEALSHICDMPGAVDAYTDSTYVIKGIREWIHGWKRRGWTTIEGTPVLNRELWQQLDDLVTQRPRGSLRWHYVRGHVGIPGNERVDAIADAFARGASVTLYAGPLSQYALPIFDVPDDTSVPVRNGAPARAASPKGSAYSYLSLVDGQLMRHATWAECESRVKGRSGARFKKAMSAADEAAILATWGITADGLRTGSQ